MTRETSTARAVPNLTGVPETMLWTLHNRVSEARRPDGILRDPRAQAIYDGLAYDFRAAFGTPGPSHAVRSALFDRELAAFLRRHPDGTVVNLGEGLETQRDRVAHPQALWISVDLPEAMAVRERFITPDAAHLHLATSALDRSWFDAVPRSRPVIVTAQGLLMYLAPADVAALVRDMARRFPRGWLVFDHIPEWLSRRSLRGWRIGPSYVAPPMPWGVGRRTLPSLIRGWCGADVEIADLPWIWPRGMARVLSSAACRIPLLRDGVPGATRVRFPDR